MAGGTGQPGATTGAKGSQSTAAPSDTTTNPFFNGANAQSQFNQTPTYINPYGTGANTLANYFAKLPSYAQPSTTGNTAFAANLAAQTATQASAQDKALKAAEAVRVQQSADALKAYQIQKANAEWQAKLDAANKQIAALQNNWGGWGVYDGGNWDPSYNGVGGATGGLASLQGFDQ